MQSTLKAAFAYFGVVFAVGFVLGTLRVLVTEPRLGSAPAVLLELPVMLTVSWRACRRIVDRFSVPATMPHRLALGAIALGLLLVAEAGVSVFAFGRTLARHLATYRTASAALGLVAQLAFASFPLLQSRRSVTRSGARAPSS